MDNQIIPRDNNQDDYLPAQGRLVTLQFVQMSLKMHTVPEYVLDSLAEGGTSFNVSLAFFGICFGALISFGTVIYNGGIDDPQKHAMYTMLTALFLVLSVFFGINTIVGFVKQRNKLKKLKEGDVITEPKQQ